MKLNLSTLYFFIPSLLATNGETVLIKGTEKLQMKKPVALQKNIVKNKNFKRKYL